MKVLVVIIFMKKHRLGFPKIGRDLQIEFRGSRYWHCARKVAYFRHFKTKSGNCITGKWIPLNLWWGHTNSYTCDQYQPITALYHFIFIVRLADIGHMYMN